MDIHATTSDRQNVVMRKKNLQLCSTSNRNASHYWEPFGEWDRLMVTCDKITVTKFNQNRSVRKQSLSENRFCKPPVMLGGLSRTWWKWKFCSDVESNVMALNNMFGSNISSNSSGNSNKSSSNSSSNSNGRTAVVAATAALCSVFRTHSKIIQDISSHEKYYFIITIIESLAFDVTELLGFSTVFIFYKNL